MTVTEDLAAASVAKAPGPRCTVCVWIAASPEADEWDAGMRVYGKLAVYTTMSKHGFTGSMSAVQRHREKHL